MLKPGKSSLKLSSYYSIALISCVGKVIEKVVHALMEWYLERYNIYPPSTTAFRRGHGSIGNLIDLVSIVQEAKSTKDMTIAVFLDVKGAFGNVRHDAIFRTTRSIGIAGRLHVLISDYHQGRLVCMSTHDGYTSFHQVRTGVVQREVLSPAAFNILLLGVLGDNIFIWTPRKNCRAIRSHLENTIKIMSEHLSTRDLDFSRKYLQKLRSRGKISKHPITVGVTRVPYVAERTFHGITLDKYLW